MGFIILCFILAFFIRILHFFLLLFFFHPTIQRDPKFIQMIHEGSTKNIDPTLDKKQTHLLLGAGGGCRIGPITGRERRRQNKNDNASLSATDVGSLAIDHGLAKRS
jgi:hypothetical protein